MLPDKVFDTNKGDFQARAELFCLLLSELGFKPYLLRHGSGRGVTYVATIDVTVDELKAVSAEVGKELKTHGIGKLNLLPVSLYDGTPVGTMPAGVLDEKGRFVSRVEVRKIRPFRLPKDAPEADIVAGRLLEQDGRPVKGFEVRLVYVDLKYPTKSFELRKKYEKKCTTDANGAFRFDGLVPGIYNMYTQDPRTGFELDRARFVRAGTNVVNVVLTPVKMVQVKVVNEREQPVAGVGVDIYLNWHSWNNSRHRNRVLTDAAGVAKLQFRSSYQYSMVLQHSEYADTYSGFDGFDAEITLTIQRGMSVSGRILAPADGLKGLQVGADISLDEVDLKLNRYAKLDNQGRFSFANLPSGKVTINVRHGYPAIYSRVVDRDKTTEVIFDLSKATNVVGTVCVEGKPKPCATLLFTGEDGQRRFARVGKDGSFEVAFLLPGTYTVTSGDWRVRTKEKEVQVEAGKKVDLKLQSR